MDFVFRKKLSASFEDRRVCVFDDPGEFGFLFGVAEQAAETWQERLNLRIQSALHTELWTSWASLLRSYAAAHGLNAPQHAVVEVSAEEITLRVGSRWLVFQPGQMETSEGTEKSFTLHEDGSVSVGNDAPEEMDFAAERFVREVMFE